MGTIPFQLGLDIATALSVVGASWAFILNNIRMKKERNKEERRKHEDQIYYEVMDKIGEIFKSYSYIIADFSRDSNTGSPNVNILFHDIEKHLPYLELFCAPIFSSYGADEQKKIVVDMSAQLREWNKNAVNAYQKQKSELFRPAQPLKILSDGIQKLASAKQSQIM